MKLSKRQRVAAIVAAAAVVITGTTVGIVETQPSPKKVTLTQCTPAAVYPNNLSVSQITNNCIQIPALNSGGGGSGGVPTNPSSVSETLNSSVLTGSFSNVQVGMTVQAAGVPLLTSGGLPVTVVSKAGNSLSISISPTVATATQTVNAVFGTPWMDPANSNNYYFNSFTTSDGITCGSPQLTLANATVTAGSPNVTFPGPISSVVPGMEIQHTSGGNNKAVIQSNTFVSSITSGSSGSTLVMSKNAGNFPNASPPISSPTVITMTFSQNPMDDSDAAFNKFSNYYASIDPGIEIDFNPGGYANMCYNNGLDANIGSSACDGIPAADNPSHQCPGGIFIDSPNANSGTPVCTGGPHSQGSIVLNGQGTYLYYNAQTAQSTGGSGTPQLNPAVDLQDQCNSAIENFNIAGSNPNTTYAGPPQAFGSGIELEGGLNVSVLNDNVQQVWGDCLEEIFYNPAAGDTYPTINEVVNDLWADNCGRTGISFEMTHGGTLTNLDIGNAGLGGLAGGDSFDFENDTGNQTSSNVVINHCSMAGAIIQNTYPTNAGPITMSNCSMNDKAGIAIADIDCTSGTFTAAQKKTCQQAPQNGPFTFSHDTFYCNGSAAGETPNCVSLVARGNYTIDNSSICMGPNAGGVYGVGGYSNLRLFGNNTSSGKYGIRGTIATQLGSVESGTGSINGFSQMGGITFSHGGSSNPAVGEPNDVSIGGNNTYSFGTVCPAPTPLPSPPNLSS